MLDIDYHHGNGTQDIFYERSDVLTISLHGHPRFAYPYFNGFADEVGEGAGKGYNLNIPLAEKLNGEQYREALRKALKRIRRFHPCFLIVSLGLDPAKDDPTGTWSLQAKDFWENGKMIGATHVPTVIVQEGGYRIRSLGINARHFFLGLWAGTNEPSPIGKKRESIYGESYYYDIETMLLSMINEKFGRSSNHQDFFQNGKLIWRSNWFENVF